MFEKIQNNIEDLSKEVKKTVLYLAMITAPFAAEAQDSNGKLERLSSGNLAKIERIIKNLEKNTEINPLGLNSMNWRREVRDYNNLALNEGEEFYGRVTTLSEIAKDSSYSISDIILIKNKDGVTVGRSFSGTDVDRDGLLDNFSVTENVLDDKQGTSKRELYTEFDTNKDRVITAEEIKEHGRVKLLESLNEGYSELLRIVSKDIALD